MPSLVVPSPARIFSGLHRRGTKCVRGNRLTGNLPPLPMLGIPSAMNLCGELQISQFENDVP